MGCPGVFYAGGKTGSLARDAATVSSIATNASEGDAGRFARGVAGLSGGNDCADVARRGDEQCVLLGAGAGVPGVDGSGFGNSEHGAVYWSGTGVAAGVCAGAGEMADAGTVRVDCRRADGNSYLCAEFDCAAGTNRRQGTADRAGDRRRYGSGAGDRAFLFGSDCVERAGGRSGDIACVDRIQPNRCSPSVGILIGRSGAVVVRA